MTAPMLLAVCVFVAAILTVGITMVRAASNGDAKTAAALRKPRDASVSVATHNGGLGHE